MRILSTGAGGPDSVVAGFRVPSERARGQAHGMEYLLAKERLEKCPSTDGTDTQVQGTGQEGARMHSFRSCDVATWDVGVGPVIEYWALDMRFKGTRVCGKGNNRV